MKTLAKSLACLLVGASVLYGESRPAPTIDEGRYADNPACTFDYWAAAHEKAPLIIFLHGGGFMGGSKDGLSGKTLEAAKVRGFAVMAIDYPFLLSTPVQEILPLCARAVQYARAHAAEWEIDPGQIFCLGHSAGAGASLWIAVHPDLADPKSADPVARESSRIQGAAIINGQVTYDLFRWEELLKFTAQPEWKSSPQEEYFFYHLPSKEAALSPAGVAARQQVDMYAMIDASDPPLLLFSNKGAGPPANRDDYLHHPRHSEAIAERAASVGEPLEFIKGEKARQTNGQRAAIDFFFSLLKPQS